VGRNKTNGSSLRLVQYFRRRFAVGRILKLRLILGVLVTGTFSYFGYNLARLVFDFQHTGSWRGLWEYEWASGVVVTDVLGSGSFQFLVLILGWSMFFRLRVTELGHLRLRRSEHKYRSIINHAGEAIFLLDHRGRVLEWNKQAEKLFGVYRRRALGVKFSRLETGLDLPVLQIFEDLERVRRSLSYETQITKDPPVQLSLTFSCIHAGTGPMADKMNSYAVIASDVTRDKQLESRMSETEKLAGIGQLAAGIAHQLNTPLGSILLSAEMLEEGARNDDETEDIQRIIRQTKQCRGIIKGLLNFARPTGRERIQLDLAATIKDTAFLMKKKLNLADVTLAVEIETEAEVFGNRNELEQVFFNLLVNAIDAMPNGGTISIALVDGDRGELKVRFSDTGEGIPAGTQDRIFLPFFTTKDYGKGTGLGLSIVARIVHEHGGRIEVESEAGRGTTFTLWFPCAQRPVPGRTIGMSD